VVNAATAISAHQEILERGYNGSSVGVIGDQADHIVETVERVTYLAETDDERLGRVDLVESVESGLAAAREAHPDAEFVFDPPDAVAVRASDRLETAVRHLLENAVEHNDAADPHVEVAVTVGAETVRLVVTDNGPGIPDQLKQSLFDPGEDGFGGGLSLVYTLVTGYGGEVSVADADPSGTRFVVELPRDEDRPTRP